MKRTERHKLKENEFARSVARAKEVLESRRRDITTGVIVVAVIAAALGGYFGWRYSQRQNATRMLASALTIHDAEVVPPPTAAPGSPAPVPQPGTYPTEQAKLEAALPRFIETADTYPGTPAGITARYYAAGILASLGRLTEAEQRYREVLDRSGEGIYGRTARLGLADVQVAQGKFDDAIAIYTEMSRDPNSQIPVDSVLIQLGRAYARAGRKEEAVRAFDRIVNEFPDSLYVGDAREELEAAKKS